MMRALGGLGEWFKPAVLKTAEGKPSVSSNLTASARIPKFVCRILNPRMYSYIRGFCSFTTLSRT